MKNEKNKENMHQENNHTMQAICDWTICYVHGVTVFLLCQQKKYKGSCIVHNTMNPNLKWQNKYSKQQGQMGQNFSQQPKSPLHSRLTIKKSLI